MKQVIDALERDIADLTQNIVVTNRGIAAAELQIERDKQQNKHREFVISETKKAIEILKAQ